MKNKGIFLLIGVVAAIAGTIVVDQIYLSRFKTQFTVLEKERIVTSNQLATAKIVYENLNHVRDLVFKNMEFPNQKDSATTDSIYFDFLTQCINDLKIKLVSMKPVQPVVQGRITVYGYDLQLECDFFKFGELCAKFENNLNLISVESFDVVQAEGVEATGGNKAASKSATINNGNKGIRVSMRINTFRVKKGTSA